MHVYVWAKYVQVSGTEYHVIAYELAASSRIQYKIESNSLESSYRIFVHRQFRALWIFNTNHIECQWQNTNVAYQGKHPYVFKLTDVVSLPELKLSHKF
jgi:hypothetical protein